jgi:hypothetical protein
MQKLPIVSKLNDIDVKKIQGQSIFDFYKQIEKILQQASSTNEISVIFSEPIVNNVREEISWYTKVSGDAKAMHTLQHEERKHVFDEITKFNISIDEITKKLEEKSGVKSLGVEALKSIFITPNIENSLFLVGSCLVIAEWGCTPHGADPRDHDLTLIDYKTFQSEDLEKFETDINSKSNSKPAILNIENNESSNFSNSLSHENKFSENEVIKSDKISKQKNYLREEKSALEIWWRWLVILLLILLLIFNIFDKNNYSTITKSNSNSEIQLRFDIQELWRKMQDKSLSCENIKSVLIAPPPIEPKPLDQKALENKDISVFEGGWQMTSDNLVEYGTERKIKFSLSFDSQGSGKVSILKIDGDVCSADSTVQIESQSRFIVTTPSLTCNNSTGGFNASVDGKITCTLISTNKADCSLQCQDGACSAEFEKSN